MYAIYRRGALCIPTEFFVPLGIIPILTYGHIQKFEGRRDKDISAEHTCNHRNYNTHMPVLAIRNLKSTGTTTCYFHTVVTNTLHKNKFEVMSCTIF